MLSNEHANTLAIDKIEQSLLELVQKNQSVEVENPTLDAQIELAGFQMVVKEGQVQSCNFILQFPAANSFIASINFREHRLEFGNVFVQIEKVSGFTFRDFLSLGKRRIVQLRFNIQTTAKQEVVSLENAFESVLEPAF